MGGSTLIIGRRFSARNFMKEARSGRNPFPNAKRILCFLSRSSPVTGSISGATPNRSATEGTAGSWNISSNDFSAGAIGRNGALGNIILEAVPDIRTQSISKRQADIVLLVKVLSGDRVNFRYKKHNIRLAFGNGLRPDIWNRFKERFNIPTIAEF
jgi:hypothetical protein